MDLSSSSGAHHRRALVAASVAVASVVVAFQEGHRSARAAESVNQSATAYYDAFEVPAATIRHLREAMTAAVPPPRFLYHWTSMESLRAWERSMGKQGKLPLKRIHNLFPIVKHFPEFQHASKRGAIFAWNNPIGSLTNDGGNERELEDLALLRIQVDPATKARVVTARLTGASPDFVETSRRIRDLDSIELLRVDYELANRTVMQEWMILNPRAIVGFTADPADLMTDLEPYLERLREGGTLTVRELYQRLRGVSPAAHWINSHSDEVVRVVERFLNSRRKVPATFRAAP